MKAPFSSIILWWDGRTLRERRMLGLMGALVLSVVGWLGVVRPLDGWKDDQARARVYAERQLVQIETAVVQSGAAPTEAADLQALVASTAISAGVEPVLGMSEGGRLGFRLERVTTAQAFGWLAALEQGGVRIEELGVVKSTDGTLGVTGAVISGG
ncbi:type II secretion system protein GspM [Brevundimonas diminuta]|uniref:type II secretion system protein GspM n=1 Tax=Brevundimonas diminuta TaxID=293 RepID=UPI003D05A039